jgi:two-component system, LuxR family, sensor kinase FixL
MEPTVEELTQELESCRKRAAGILETAVNAIIVISERGEIETVNEAAVRMFGYSRDEMLGQNVKMLMPEPYRRNHDSYLQNYLQTGVKKIIGVGREAVGLRRDGSVFPIDLSVGEVMLKTGRIFTGIIRDMSERKRLEQKLLSISEEEQARIGRDIHDDLCQQLAAIGCLSRAVYNRLSAADAPEALQLAEITRLISNANARAREMSRGLMPVTLDSQGLMAALAELASSTERIFRVSCPFLCEEEVNLTDNRLSVQLYRIAQEAVANAIKHSHSDRIEIVLAMQKSGLQLSITDNGVGIPDNVAGQSTGMGLLTMSHRARVVGGSLSIQTLPHGGSRVLCEVRLPS